MSEVVYFSTKEMKIKAFLINSVLLHDGIISILVNESMCKPHVIINDNFIFFAERGLVAIDELLKIDFYNDKEHNEATEHFKAFMSAYKDKG